MTYEELVGILAELHPESDFDKEEHLIDDKIFTSFDVVSIIAEVDDRFDITVPAGEIVPANFNSARALFALLTRLEDGD